MTVREAADLGGEVGLQRATGCVTILCQDIVKDFWLTALFYPLALESVLARPEPFSRPALR